MGLLSDTGMPSVGRRMKGGRYRLMLCLAMAYLSGYGLFVWMLLMDVSVALFDPGFSGMASLPNVDLTTCAGFSVHAWTLESQVVLHWPKEARNLPRCEVCRLDVVPGQHVAYVMEGCADRRKKGDYDALLWAHGDSFCELRAL